MSFKDEVTNADVKGEGTMPEGKHSTDAELVLVEATHLLAHYSRELAAARSRIAALEAGAARISEKMEWDAAIGLRALPDAAAFGQQMLLHERTRLLLKSLSPEQLRHIHNGLSFEQGSALAEVYREHARLDQGSVPS